MARPLRIQFPGAFYHVMNRGISHAPIFYDGDADRALFKQTLADAVDLWKIRIHAYSLMDNHYHFLIETPLPNISRAMQHIDGIYTQRFNRKHHRDGPLIRGRFKSILVDADTYFLELVRYIHLNGVRARRFPSARVDRDCSHWDYIHPKRAVPWLEMERVLSHFSHDLQAFDTFIHQGVDDQLQSILDRKRWPVILGAEGFVENIRSRFVRAAESAKGLPQVRELRLARAIEPHRLIEEILDLYGKHYVSQGQDPMELNREGRWVIMMALRRYSHLTYQETAMIFGEISYAAVEKFIKRNNYSGTPFSKNIERQMQSQMSNVEL